jgi:two-component system sensor histidine kinase CpxA
LFIKTFLWFWLAAAVVGVVVFLALVVPSSAMRGQLDATLDRLTAMLARDTVQVYEQDGPDAAARYLRQLRDDTGIELFLLNDRGEPALAQNVPDEERRLANSIRSEPAAHAERRVDPPLIAHALRGPSGARFAIVGHLPGGPLATLASRPGLMFLRLVLILTLAGLVCYGFARHLTGPLQKLRTAVRSVADGNLSVRAGAALAGRRDEIGDLGRDFDLMAERIELLVTSQRRLLRDVSHELRSPLTRLGMALGLAMKRAGPQAGSALDRIELEAQRLNELICSLLLASKLETSTSLTERTAIAWATVLRDVFADAAFEAEAAGKSVRLVNVTECRTVGSLELLKSAVENVVRNAVRYTAEGTAVEVSLELQERGERALALLRVRDHGPGVPDELLSQLFQPFYRVGEDRGWGGGGVGLGLFIAQQAVRLHGGTIVIHNHPEGGLVVEIAIPAVPTENSVRVDT